MYSVFLEQISGPGGNPLRSFPHKVGGPFDLYRDQVARTPDRPLCHLFSSPADLAGTLCLLNESRYLTGHEKLRRTVALLVD